MIHYTSDQINHIFESEEFNTNYIEYRKTIDTNFLKFLDLIDINKNYYKLHVSTKKYKNLSEDSINIKEINGLLNKVAEKNYKEYSKKIVIILKKDVNILSFFIDSIVEKCILQNTYLQYYIYILVTIKSNIDITTLLEKTLIKYYNILNENSKETELYKILCENNRKIDNYIGYCRMITQMEMNDIVSDKLNNLIDYIFNEIGSDTNEDNIYKYINCLYEIIKINNNYKNIIMGKLENYKSPNKKIKFKIMDMSDL